MQHKPEMRAHMMRNAQIGSFRASAWRHHAATATPAVLHGG